MWRCSGVITGVCCFQSEWLTDWVQLVTKYAILKIPLLANLLKDCQGTYYDWQNYSWSAVSKLALAAGLGLAVILALALADTLCPY